jgi:hypothetical protein
MAMDARRRRALLRTWVPTGIIAGIIVAVVVTTSVLLGNGLGAPPPAPTAGQVTEINRSVFTDDGLEYIASTRVVRIDLSIPPTQAEPLGLPADGEVVLPVIATGDTELDYSVRVYGGGAEPGGLSLVAPTVTVRTESGAISSIEAPSREVRPFRELLTQLTERAEELGWPDGEQERVLAEVAAATSAGEPYSFEVGPGDRLGVEVSIRADCEPDGFCASTWLLVPRTGETTSE